MSEVIRPRVGIINIVESGHDAARRLWESILRDAREIWAPSEDISVEPELHGAINLFEGRIELNEKLYEKLIGDIDAVVGAFEENKVTDIFLIAGGPYILYTLALWRLMRTASYANIYIAFWDPLKKDYEIWLVDDLQQLVYKPRVMYVE